MLARIRFITGSLSGREVPLEGSPVRVGRDPDMEVIIPPGDERFVSREHAAILREGDRYVLEDRDSTNGTLVNGTRVTRVALASGDEIQFGRQGPVAQFLLGGDVPEVRAAAPEAETVVGAPDAGRDPGGGVRMELAAGAPPPGSPPVADDERPSQLVRRLVDEALARDGGAGRARTAVFAGTILAVLAALLVGGSRMAAGGDEAAFRRLADDYRDRVVLVEVGLQLGDEYRALSNGSGFVADEGGLILTNKHVVRGDLYDSGLACLAESLRRAGSSYIGSLVVTVWQGGRPFRRQRSDTAGDPDLGYSTARGTLDLAGMASDRLLAPRTISCPADARGPAFTFAWRQHASDNGDLAVLRASDSLPAIPLSNTLPEPDAPIMVYGFPQGLTPLETNEAEPLRRTGRVLRTQETIQIDAVVLHGNSGGPLIDRKGHVVGITTRGPAETLNMAIRVDHARPLLEHVRESPPR